VNVPREVGHRLQDISEASARLHERLAELQHWAWNEQGIAQLPAGRSMEALFERQQEMLKAIQDLAVALDTWISLSQSLTEHYLPRLVRLLIT
jgi:hypothetical protein